MSAPQHNALGAQQEAVTRVRAELLARNMDEIIRRTGVGWHRHSACASTSDPPIETNAKRILEISLFGGNLQISVADFTIAPAAAACQTLSPTEELLVLRYLAAPCKVRPTGEQITFRDLPGGQFYLQPILNRTTVMLARRFGANVNALRTGASRLPHRVLGLGDFGAAFQAIGNIEITLVFRAADDEFPASADIAFDRIVSRIYHTDEVAALAHLLCRKLM